MAVAHSLFGYGVVVDTGLSRLQAHKENPCPFGNTGGRTHCPYGGRGPNWMQKELRPFGGRPFGGKTARFALSTGRSVAPFPLAGRGVFKRKAPHQNRPCVGRGFGGIWGTGIYF